jgi:hypothetical protein
MAGHPGNGERRARQSDWGVSIGSATAAELELENARSWGAPTTYGDLRGDSGEWRVTAAQ